MSRDKVVKLRKSSVAAAQALAPGLHPARIERRESKAIYRLLDTTGRAFTARIAEDVEEAFVEECMRERRTVLVTPGEGDTALVLGALQTSRSVWRDRQDTVRLEGKRVELEATDGVDVRVGKSTIRLDRRGAVKIVGQRMTIDVAEVVRVLSALCELP
jgi:hypothetical protein